MAADGDVIRQFLVSLGFTVDQTGLKKMLGGLEGTTKAALTTGKAVLGVAVAAEAMVLQFASSMEKLYYQSRRTGASVENLQALEFGSRKIGLAAGQAREALESMTSAVRMNPGMRGLIDGLLGKNTAGLDQAEVMIELVQKLAAMPHYQGAQYAAMFGMDERTFFQLKQGLPELIAAEKERREMNRNAGIDAQAAAEAGKEYANSIRDITTRVGVLRDKLAVELLPAFRSFNKELIDGLDNLAKFRLSEHPDLERAVKAVPSTLMRTPLGAPVNAAIEGWRWLWGKVTGSGGPGGTQSVSGRITPAAPSAGPLGLRQNNPGNLRSWGAAPQQNGFAVFPSAAVGLSAMAGNLLGYYDNHGLRDVRSIIARWAPSSENNTGAYVDAVSKRLGVKPGDELNLKDPATLARLMGAMIQQEQGYNPYGSSELMAAAQGRLGKGSVTINQKTEIKVDGADSPTETARAVALVQDQVTGNMVRNLRGAVR
jgi:hypothetical protein